MYVYTKTRFKNILRPDINYTELFSAIHRMHLITTYTYQFLKAFVIDCFDKNSDMPDITENFLRLIIKVICIKAPRSRALTEDNKKIFDQLQNFYDSKLNNTNMIPVDGLHLDNIVGYTITEMLTSIKNNIVANFSLKVKSYVTLTYKDEIKDEINKLKKKKVPQSHIKEKYKELTNEINLIKNDLLNNNEILLSNKKYHKWIKQERNKLFPELIQDSNDASKTHTYNVHVKPLEYLKHYVYLAKKMEEFNNEVSNTCKSFNFLPLRRSFVEKSIVIDTSSIIKLIKLDDTKLDDTKQSYLENICEKEDEIWSTVFKMKGKKYRRKGYTFNNYIVTNGYDVSIRFINNNNMKAEKNRKLKMTIGRRKAFQEKKKCKEMGTKYVTISEKLSVTEKKPKIRKTQKKEIEEKKYVDGIPYIEDASESEREELKKRKLLYIDPGKIRLLTMIDNEGKTMKYTCGQRLRETKRYKYREKLNKYAEKEGIKEKEKKLSEYNSKTSEYKKYIEYITEKNKIMNEVGDKYNKEEGIYKKYKWYGYINRQRSEARIVNKIKEEYGEDIIIIMGDWSENTQKKRIKRISVPGASLRRLLKENFRMYMINEYNTSKLNYKTEEETKNLIISKERRVPKYNKKKMEEVKVHNERLNEEDRELKRIHSVLTYKMENNRMGCINRDINSVKNMRKITKHILERGERPEKYKIDYHPKTKEKKTKVKPKSEKQKSVKGSHAK
ncbi:MAG: hypothetical protein Edafosvirus1_45 [Edafosvirus sp.]|uniref:Uncharacterized protein n=1 Tax=Edafosvirus sp. TaxID=2487765 RepID=A0A3G4ZTQ9_9VIRU|nr:MAG: hypothetical protein Edafosvirus1_45 [Edafosvirus sp.]